MAGSQTISLAAETRKSGKGFARGLRKDRRVPGVVYGPKTEPLTCSITEIDAVKYGKHGFENAIFTLASSDSKLNGLKVLRKAMDFDPVSRRPIHMDFFAPDMTQKVRVNVEIRFTGKPEGVKEGGIFNIARRDVEIECLPLEIPEFFEADVSHLGVDQSIHVSDVKFPETVRVLTSPQETLATVSIITEEDLARAMAPTPEAAPAEGGEATAAAPAATTTAAAPAADKAPAKK